MLILGMNDHQTGGERIRLRTPDGWIVWLSIKYVRAHGTPQVRACFDCKREVEILRESLIDPITGEPLPHGEKQEGANNRDH